MPRLTAVSLGVWLTCGSCSSSSPNSRPQPEPASRPGLETPSQPDTAPNQGPKLGDASVGADVGYVTIPFEVSDECPGGAWYVDGEAQGHYPVARHPVVAGEHTIRIESGNGHCAGIGQLAVAIEVGTEHVLAPDGFRR